MTGLTHLDATGRARMVDVSDKPVTGRRAVAQGRLIMAEATLATLLDGGLAKGDALAVARIAGIQAAKKTGDLIPLCHPLPISAVTVEFQAVAATGLDIRAEVRTTGQTGVEMEALTAVSVAGLTVYDMVKAIDRGVRLTDIRLTLKEGGKSGRWEAA
ncbi:MAG: cyclic pyranopterin monophosphate synthase MoaC [Rhodothalassiaceae bacterium]